MPVKRKTPKKNQEIKEQVVRASLKRNYKKVSIFVLLILGILILGYGLSKWAIVAWVDGKPITRFEYYKKLENSGAGKEIKDQMIVERLVYSEAQKKGVGANQNEINKEFNSVKQQIGTESMKMQLAQVNMSEDDFKKQLQTRILIRKLFGSNINISENELDKYIEDQQKLFGQTSDSPALTDTEKEKIKEELILQKIQENFSKWVKEVQNSSRVIKQ